jgi:hypothetical protein
VRPPSWNSRDGGFTECDAGGMHPVLVITLVALGVYLVSCFVHPYMKCSNCNRSKEHHSSTFKGAFGTCRACGGRGHTVRLGAKLLGRK